MAMATDEATHEDVNARLLELVYDELEAAERAPLQAHVDGCARCQADLTAFAQTRAVARQVLADDAPPTRARAAILRAAAEVATARAPMAAAATKPPAREAKPSL